MSKFVLNSSNSIFVDSSAPALLLADGDSITIEAGGQIINRHDFDPAAIASSGALFGTIAGTVQGSVAAATNLSIFIGRFGYVDGPLSAGGILQLVNEAFISGRVSGAEVNVINTGRIAGGIHASSDFGSFVKNSGFIDGAVQLGGGDDVFEGFSGNSVRASLGAGDDRFSGSAFRDSVLAGQGDDSLGPVEIHRELMTAAAR